MIRVATEEDLPLILKLASNFIEAANYQHVTDPDKIKQVISDFLSSPKTEKIIILYEDFGVIAGSVAEMNLASSKIATESIWWVEPEKRTKEVGTSLLKAFEYWAKQVGAKYVSMACLDEQVGKVYEKLGYTLTERVYLKEI